MAQLSAIWPLLLLIAPLGAQAEDSLRITGSEYYFSDNLICDGDGQDGSLSGEWNGRLGIVAEAP
jgi:hypothetical protein